MVIGQGYWVANEKKKEHFLRKFTAVYFFLKCSLVRTKIED